MRDSADHELLRRYADHGAEDAFTELVQRHLNLVWGAARRVSGNAELARDVAQIVFTDLARKAGRLPRGTVLAGWLHQAACHAAANEVRDAALAELSEADRSAVVLRYLSGRSLAEVGLALGIGEDAAQKRVSRAVDRMRDAFRRRGVTVGAGLTTAVLDLAGAQQAPAGLAGWITAGALTAGRSAGGTAASGVFMKSRLTLGIAGGVAVIVALSWQQHHITRLAGENSELRRQRVAPPDMPASGGVPGTEALTRLREQQEELLRLRGEVARLRRAGRQALPAASTAPAVANGEIDALATQALIAEAASTKLIQTMKFLGLAARIFSTDHQGRLPTTFDEIRSEVDSLAAAEGLWPDGVPLELFEFFPHERAVSEREPQLILFQEKAARRLPNGTWERIYSLMDGSVLRINRADGDFSEFELARTATRTNTPRQP